MRLVGLSVSVTMIARTLNFNLARVDRHLRYPEKQTQESRSYYAAHGPTVNKKKVLIGEFWKQPSDRPTPSNYQSNFFASPTPYCF